MNNPMARPLAENSLDSTTFTPGTPAVQGSTVTASTTVATNPLSASRLEVIRKGTTLVWDMFTAPLATMRQASAPGDWRAAFLPLAVGGTVASIPAFARSIDTMGVNGSPLKGVAVVLLSLLATAFLLALVTCGALAGWLVLRTAFRMAVPAHAVLRVVGLASIPVAAQLAVQTLAAGGASSHAAPLSVAHAWSLLLLVAGLAHLRSTNHTDVPLTQREERLWRNT